MAKKLANGDNDVRLRGGRWWKEVGWRHVFGIIVIIYCVFPLLYVLSASLNTNGSITGSLRLFTSFTTEHYAELMTTDYPKWALHSLYVSGVEGFRGMLCRK